MRKKLILSCIALAASVLVSAGAALAWFVVNERVRSDEFSVNAVGKKADITVRVYKNDEPEPVYDSEAGGNRPLFEKLVPGDRFAFEFAVSDVEQGAEGNMRLTFEEISGQRIGGTDFSMLDLFSVGTEGGNASYLGAGEKKWGDDGYEHVSEYLVRADIPLDPEQGGYVRFDLTFVSARDDLGINVNAAQGLAVRLGVIRLEVT